MFLLNLFAMLLDCYVWKFKQIVIQIVEQLSMPVQEYGIFFKRGWVTPTWLLFIGAVYLGDTYTKWSWNIPTIYNPNLTTWSWWLQQQHVKRLGFDPAAIVRPEEESE
eukprot:Selendium_serpulae@DN5543_c0_g2_i3.p1